MDIKSAQEKMAELQENKREKIQAKIEKKVKSLEEMSDDLYGSGAKKRAEEVIANIHSLAENDPDEVKLMLQAAIPGIVSVEGVRKSKDPSTPDRLVISATKPYSDDNFAFTYQIPIDKLDRLLNRKPLPKTITEKNVDDVIDLINYFSEDPELKKNEAWGKVEKNDFLYETELMKVALKTIDDAAVSFRAFVETQDNNEPEIRYDAEYGGNGFVGVRYVSLSDLIRKVKEKATKKQPIQIESKINNKEDEFTPLKASRFYK